MKTLEISTMPPLDFFFKNFKKIFKHKISVAQRIQEIVDRISVSTRSPHGAIQHLVSDVNNSVSRKHELLHTEVVAWLIPYRMPKPGIIMPICALFKLR